MQSTQPKLVKSTHQPPKTAVQARSPPSGGSALCRSVVESTDKGPDLLMLTDTFSGSATTGNGSGRSTAMVDSRNSGATELNINLDGTEVIREFLQGMYEHTNDRAKKAIHAHDFIETWYTRASFQNPQTLHASIPPPPRHSRTSILRPPPTLPDTRFSHAPSVIHACPSYLQHPMDHSRPAPSSWRETLHIT